MGTRNCNGEGTCYFSKNVNRWIGQYTEPHTGKRKSVSAKTKKECMAMKRKALAEAESGKYSNTNKTTVSELCGILDKLDYESNKLKPTSYVRRGEIRKRIEQMTIGNMQVKKVKRQDIQEALSSITHYSNSTISKIVQRLRKVFEEACLRKIIIENPMLGIESPKSKKEDKEIRAFTLEEQKIFKQAIEHEHKKNIFLISMLLGLRCGEVLALKVEDIDFEAKTLQVQRTISDDDNDKPIISEWTKTDAGMRTLPLDNCTVEILKEAIRKMILNPQHLLFVQQSKDKKEIKLICPTAINTVFKRICKNAGLQIQKDNKFLTMHSLRHTYATRSIEAGAKPEALKVLMGHSDIATTLNIYTSVTEEHKKEQAEKITQYLEQKNII